MVMNKTDYCNKMSSRVRNAMQFKYKIAMIGHLPQAQFHGWNFIVRLKAVLFHILNITFKGK